MTVLQTILPKLWAMELYMPQREILEIERQAVQVNRDKKVEAITPVVSPLAPCHTEQLRFRRKGLCCGNVGGLRGVTGLRRTRCRFPRPIWWSRPPRIRPALSLEKVEEGGFSACVNGKVTSESEIQYFAILWK